MTEMKNLPLFHYVVPKQQAFDGLFAVSYCLQSLVNSLGGTALAGSFSIRCEDKGELYEITGWRD